MQTHWHDLRFMLTAVLGAARFFGAPDADAANLNFGSVYPIATNPAALEFAGGGAFDGTNFLVALTTASASSIDIAAQLVSPSGTLISTQVGIASGVSGQPPGAAFGVSNYLGRWRNNFASPGPTVLGQLITRAGAKVGSAFPITQGAGTSTRQVEGSVGFGRTNFLALWHDTAGTNYTLYGQFVSPSGALVGTPLTIASLGDDGTDTGMAFDGTNFLAAWYSLGASGRSIYAAIISQARTFVVPPFLVSQSLSSGRNGVSVGFDGTNFLCVWSQWLPANNPPLWHIRGRLVSRSGAFAGNDLALTTNTTAQVVPSLAFDGVNYLLSWGEVNANTNSNISFQFLNRSAQAVGQRFTPFSSVGTNPPVVGVALFDGIRFDAIADIGTIGLFTGGPTTASAVYGISIPASDARPTLHPVLPSTNGQFRVRLEGTPGINYALQVATNRLWTNAVWTSLTTNSPSGGGSFDYTDTHATNSNRFYRAQRL